MSGTYNSNALQTDILYFGMYLFSFSTRQAAFSCLQYELCVTMVTCDCFGSCQGEEQQILSIHLSNINPVPVKYLLLFSVLFVKADVAKFQPESG